MDKKVCFLITVFDEWDLVLDTYSRLKHFHPESEILVVSDGTCPLTKGIELIECSRTKLPESGGVWINNYIQQYLENSSRPYLVKLDPDTGVHSPLNYLPHHDTWGHVHTHLSGKLVIESNSLGMTRKSASRIIESKYLREDKYNSNNPITYPLANGVLVPMTDWMILEVILRLGLTIGPWEDITCSPRFKGVEPSTPLSHPYPLSARQHLKH